MNDTKLMSHALCNKLTLTWNSLKNDKLNLMKPTESNQLDWN